MTHRPGLLVMIAAALAGCAGDTGNTGGPGESLSRAHAGAPPVLTPPPGATPAPRNIPAGDRPTDTPRPATPRWVVLSPGLRIDRARSLLEFDGVVAIDCHNPATPDVYLELVACSPDTREHESLVVTAVPPSMIHAALLALGFEPGRPGAVSARDGSPARAAPTGTPLTVELVVAGRPRPVSAWITDVRTRTHHPQGGWVFAGSRLVLRGGGTVYDADGAGTVIGLDTFGSETIAFTRVISPDSWVDEPVWIADDSAVPARGTPLHVRIGRGPDADGRPSDEASAPGDHLP